MAATRTEMKTLLEAAAIPRVTVYDHETAAKNLARPLAVTVFCSGVTPVAWLMQVRHYAFAATDPEQAQKDTDTNVLLIEAALDGHYGEMTWDIGYVEELDCILATTVIPVGREDF